MARYATPDTTSVRRASPFYPPTHAPGVGGGGGGGGGGPPARSRSNQPHTRACTRDALVHSTAAQAERVARLRDGCPVAEAGSAELELLAALLQFDPASRPTAAAALKLPYFAPLPAELVPNVAEPTRTPEEIESTFAFEYEKMGVNDLRILIANDLFRMNRTL